MVQLDKELHKLAQKDKTNADPLNEVKLLLEGDTQQDLHIMRHLAGNSELIQNEKALGKQLELEKLNDKYGTTFTYAQIHKLALKYRLRFLSSNYFKGKMDVQTIAKLKEFAKDHNVSCLDEHSLGSKFFILAPRESFNTNNTTLKYLEEREREARRIARDPVLFYKIDEDHYRMVHKWGNDFTIFRRAIGYYWESYRNYARVHVVLAVLTALATMKLLFKWKTTFVWTCAPENHWCDCKTLAEATDAHSFKMGIFFTILSIAAGFAYYLIAENRVTDGNSNPRSIFFSKHVWNSRERLLRTNRSL